MGHRMTALRYVPRDTPRERQSDPVVTEVLGVAVAWVMRFVAVCVAIIVASFVLGLATRIFLATSGVAP